MHQPKMLKARGRSVLLTALFLAIFPLALFGQTLGDVDLNGKITIIDALMTAQYYVGLNPQGFQAANADVDANGAVNIIDALMIAQYYVGSITVFPGSSQSPPTPSTPPASQLPGETTRISLNGNSISVSGPGAAANGSTVTISSPGTYSLNGTLNNGQVVVNSADEGAVTLILNGVNITNNTNAPIAIMDAKDMMIILADNTVNTLTDGTNYVFPTPDDDEPNATLFSKDDLDISGNGTLNIKANYNDGISCKDDLKIYGGNIIINSKDDGIRGKNSIKVKGGTITVTAGGDGFKSDDAEDSFIGIENGTVKITSVGDAIGAEMDVQINDGTLNLTTGGGSGASSDKSAKGIKGLSSTVIYGGNITINAADDCIHSDKNITINGGTMNLSAADDGLHANETVIINNGTIDVVKSVEGIESASITINDGKIHVYADDDGINATGPEEGDPFSAGNFYIYINGGYIVVDINPVTLPGSTGGDGLDSNGYMEMRGGTVIVNGGINVDSAIDYNGTFKMMGGLIVGVGTSTMAMAPGGNGSTQNALLYNFTEKQGGVLINIQNANGTNLVTFAPKRQYSSIAFSSPLLQTGSSYNVYFGGSSTGTATDGLYTGGTYNRGTLGTNFTVSGLVTTIGGGGFPGWPW